ncbi:molybdopterin converting factor subunit 1 [Agarivorans sp. MS3-6]|uniref:molybdopterin converting factor subunit 1 n=1 Tax=Agarivorans sp. TSD2052 TaxID=2937286 RepID=UPI00200F6EE3|nr:molybdopterin converting factor subunit 1 [Agarivorans sp. TSD2052]UPW20415.1 molybdopterin converting factor subunit 1 [Agarivorans sp. TSD2052]
MLIKVLFFARLKEQLGCSSINIELVEGSNTENLTEQLINTGSAWSVLADDSVLVALNQQQINDVQRLKNGDEVAFFPPVTGG